ncbi:MAG: beta-ketoacyl-[acyl-carrier-protein] synthase family protein, partial [Bacteroidia bacterium]|nr:beta-ketoacyl-[acyl-carrier-protein] synthase family protein [Bacteroidia bacterium]
MSSRVFITGFGIISSIGKNANENFQSLVNQRTGYSELEVVETMHRRTLRSCEVKLSDDELCSLAHVMPFQGYTRTALLGLIAVGEALRTA